MFWTIATIGGLTAMCLSILSALLVAAMAVADALEDRNRRRQRERYQNLTTFQQGLERIMNQEQPR